MTAAMKGHSGAARPSRRVLVIKLGAIGDFVQSTGAFADIRAHEAVAEITLLTAPSMMVLAHAAPFFDRIEVDRRLPFWRLDYVVELARRIRGRGYDMVYDLQASGRTTRYWRLMGRPQWNGIAPGCSHPHTNPKRSEMHAVEIFRDQFREIGVPATHAPDVSWAGEPLDGEIRDLVSGARGRRIALIPGSAPTRPEKRWPGYGEFAELIVERGDTPYLVGAGAERELLSGISATSGAVNLCGRLSLNQLVTLFGAVDAVVGNDTGPMHVAAAAGAAGVAILGPASDPVRHAPASPHMRVLSVADFASLDAAQVLSELDLAMAEADSRQPG